MRKFLEDSEGNKSSKRLNGTILIWIGISIGVVSWFISLFHPLGDASFIVKMVVIFIATGSGLDLSGICDGVFKNKSKKC